MRNLIIALLSVSMLIATQAKADEVLIKGDAPDRYVVVKGDTLWAISGRFLKSPWRWPEIWRMNKEEIKNPHWIYPGDVVLLDRASGTLRLVKNEKYQGKGFIKLEPKARIESNENAAIPIISPADIGPFLSQPLVVGEDGLKNAPRIIANEEGRVVIGAGSRAYARGISAGDAKQWHIFRPGKALVDPDTKQVLGYEAIYLGEARVLKYGETTTIEIIKAVQEILRDDRLVAATTVDLANFVPHAPTRAVRGKIIDSYGGVAEAGRNSIVTLNKGSVDGLDIGSVLAILRTGEVAAYRDDDDKKPQLVKLPEERYGLLLIFRTFERVSYALVMQSTLSVNVGDSVENP